jgi:hypothetical protein
VGVHRRKGHSTHAPAAIAVTVFLVAGVAAAALLAACGGSSGGGSTAEPSERTSPAASLAPSPGSSPLTGTPREAVEAFWRLVDADAYGALAAAAAPGSPCLPTAESDDIESVEVLRVARIERQPGSALAQVDVRVEPASAVTPWGAKGRHTLFVRLLERAPGEWLVAGWGTSP